MHAPISVVIPTLNNQDQLPETLMALMEGLPKGMIREVIVSDGGSSDATCRIADSSGAVVLDGPACRGSRLRAGADIAKGKWLLFLHPGTVLVPGWTNSVDAHLAAGQAGFGKLRFLDGGMRGVLVAGWANLRSRFLGLPLGDQSLLVPMSLYQKVGGYPDQPAMEDVAMARALKGHLQPLGYTAQISAVPYQNEGWLRRGGRNLWARFRYLTGAKPETLAARFGR